MLLRTTIERNPIIPIVKIEEACRKNPNFPTSIMQSVLISKVMEYIEIAEIHGGRLLNMEEYPKLEKYEEIGILIQLIFNDDKELEMFCNKVN